MLAFFKLVAVHIKSHRDTSRVHRIDDGVLENSPPADWLACVRSCSPSWTISDIEKLVTVGDVT